MSAPEYSQEIIDFLEPFNNAKEMDEFLVKHFNIELAWDIVDEKSTSSPLRFMWAAYKALKTGKGSNRHVLAVSRNGAKSLSSSILQFFSMIHFRRDGLHLAATLDQADAVISYIDNFLRHPFLEQFSQTDNKKEKELLNLPPNSYTTRSHAKLKVGTASIKGVNSQRASLLTFDEVDLTPMKILQEAAYIADPAIVYRPDGTTEKLRAVFVYLSSRKTNNGPIQSLIDEAEGGEGAHKKPTLHKWSVADLMERCPPEQHKPEKPVTAWINEDTLETIWGQEAYEANRLRIQASNWLERKAFAGCQGCPAWLACQGRSVKQRGKSFMLRNIEFVGDVLSTVKEPGMIIAQALNWKPETKGLVFRTFETTKHVKAHKDFYKWVTFGKRFDPYKVGDLELDRIEFEGTMTERMAITPSKENIYQAMTENGWSMISGVDWGYEPDPAVCVVGGYHKKYKKCAILHVQTAQRMANHVFARYACENIYSRFPVEFVNPDHADTSSFTYFKPFGVRSLDRKQKPARIETGVSFLRGLIWNPTTEEYNFAILDDSVDEDTNKFAIMELKTHQHATNALGEFISNKFEDKNNHSIDAMRYMLHLYTLSKKSKASSDMEPEYEPSKIRQAAINNDPAAKQFIEQKSELKSQMQDYFKEHHGLDDPFATPEAKKTKPGVKNRETKKTGTLKFRF